MERKTFQNTHIEKNLLTIVQTWEILGFSQPCRRDLAVEDKMYWYKAISEDKTTWNTQHWHDPKPDRRILFMMVIEDIVQANLDNNGKMKK